MKNLLLIFIVFAFLGCNFNAKDKNKTNVFPVITDVSVWFLYRPAAAGRSLKLCLIAIEVSFCHRPAAAGR